MAGLMCNASYSPYTSDRTQQLHADTRDDNGTPKDANEMPADANVTPKDTVGCGRNQPNHPLSFKRLPEWPLGSERPLRQFANNNNNTPPPFSSMLPVRQQKVTSVYYLPASFTHTASGWAHASLPREIQDMDWKSRKDF